MEKFLDVSVMLLLMVGILLMVAKRHRERIIRNIKDSTAWGFGVPATIFAICALPIVLRHGFGNIKLLLLALFFAVPTVILLLKRILCWGDWANLSAALCIFFPEAYRWVPAWADTPFGKGIPIAYLGMSIYILTFFSAMGDIEVHSSWKLSKEDGGSILKMIVMLFVGIVPIGLGIHFLVPNMHWFHAHRPWHMPIMFILIFVLTAIHEEVLCRGIIQKALLKKLGVRTGIALAGVIFGIGHITRIATNSAAQFGYPNWWYVLFATIAGAGYGYVYYLRKSLIASATTHTAVDFIWGIFFRN